MKQYGSLRFLCLSVIACAVVAENSDVTDTDFLMPQVQPKKADTYMCTAMELDKENDHYIVGFTPHGSMMTAHHMLLFGCTYPGSDQPAWNCGEMASGEGEQDQYEMAGVCQGGPQIIYAWALDAKKLELPKGAGFKVGGHSPIKYLVLQVHYMHPMQAPDSSGMTLQSTEEVMPRRAGTLLMVTEGRIEPGTTEKFETACEIDEPVEMHPFAFRTHTHKLGKVVSGWKVDQQDQNGENKWTLIGKQDPMKPEMFYPVKNQDLTVSEGDIVAARCTMKNDRDHTVAVGATGADEMCNFYMMYWVEGDRILKDNTCLSPGPPNYYWGSEGGLNNIPDKEASTL